MSRLEYVFDYRYTPLLGATTYYPARNAATAATLQTVPLHKGEGGQEQAHARARKQNQNTTAPHTIHADGATDNLTRLLVATSDSPTTILPYNA